MVVIMATSLPAKSTQDQTPAPIRRRYPAAPLVGVAAAVFNAAGQVLLIQRGRPPRAGQWGLPGGLLDLGETLAEGARRELREECNVEIAIGGIAGVFEPITLDSTGLVEYHYVVVDFWASHVSGEAVAGDDAAGIAWIDFDQLDSLGLLPESRQVIIDAQRAWAQAAEMHT
jgi:ADP-ribose pyrophosphatase YjhB (NUDIX family)